MGWWNEDSKSALFTDCRRDVCLVQGAAIQSSCLMIRFC